MKKQSADILNKLYRTLFSQIEEAKKCEKYNFERIEEINAYLNAINEKEDINYNLFSPRKVESEFKYQIDESNKEKEECETKKNYYNKRYCELKEYAYEIERILKLEDIRK